MAERRGISRAAEQWCDEQDELDRRSRERDRGLAIIRDAIARGVYGRWEVATYCQRCGTANPSPHQVCGMSSGHLVARLPDA